MPYTCPNGHQHPGHPPVQGRQLHVRASARLPLPCILSGHETGCPTAHPPSDRHLPYVEVTGTPLYLPSGPAASTASRGTSAGETPIHSAHLRIPTRLFRQGRKLQDQRRRPRSRWGLARARGASALIFCALGSVGLCPLLCLCTVRAVRSSIWCGVWAFSLATVQYINLLAPHPQCISRLRLQWLTCTCTTQKDGHQAPNNWGVLSL